MHHAVSVVEEAEPDTPLLVASLRNNRSAYLIDSGLWTACRESRRIIHQVFAERCKLDAMQRITGCFQINGRELYLTYFPTNDLLCFQRRDLRHLLHWMSKRSVMPPFLDKRIVNFAVEYDQQWGNLFEEELPSLPYTYRRSMDGTIFRACSKAIAQSFWVIDDVPRPKPGDEAPATSAYEFQGNGERFVSADNVDSWDFWYSSSQIFIRRLHRAVHAWEAFVTANSMIRDFGPPPETLGVLCCVK